MRINPKAMSAPEAGIVLRRYVHDIKSLQPCSWEPLKIAEAIEIAQDRMLKASQIISTNESPDITDEFLANDLKWLAGRNG